MAAALKAMIVLMGTTPLLAGCAAHPAAAAQAQQPGSILFSSSPAAGSTVREPVDSLELHFMPLARLDQVTIGGPDGTMPMMVHAVGEVAEYSLPLVGLGPGTYTVDWKATSQGREYRGQFDFRVRN